MEQRELIIPERLLLIALFRRALFDYFGTRPLEKSSAEEWLFDDDSFTDYFSFAWVCNQLSMDAASVRRRLRGMTSLAVTENFEMTA